MPKQHSETFLQGLLEHGSPTTTQRWAIEAVRRHGGISHAARVEGRARSALQARIAEVRRKAARAGYAPDQGLHAPYPDGYRMGKVTIQRSADGGIERTWERMCEDRERQAEATREAIRALAEDVPRVKARKGPRHVRDELAACYILSDAHLGMLAWGEETRGADWDTDIAERTIMRWMEHALDAAPRAHTGVLAQLGDLLHHDGLESVTPTSGNVLDADTRFQRLVRIAVRVLRAAVDLMLKKHHQVHIILAEGNHDMASSVWLREVFAALYEHEPRVTVDRSPDPYYVFEWGRTMVGFHHGHKTKLPELTKALVGKFPEVYGRTTYRYAHAGHLHHAASQEDQLMIPEQHPTLAAMDAHSTRLGYSSQRGAPVITYHRRHGEVGRTTIRPQMVLDDEEAA